MPDINTLARYAAATPATDGELLELCMEAAQAWLENAGVPRLKKSALYDMAVYQLATHYFDNRGVIAERDAHVPMGVMSIMHQLRSGPESVTK